MPEEKEGRPTVFPLSEQNSLFEESSRKQTLSPARSTTQLISEMGFTTLSFFVLVIHKKWHLLLHIGCPKLWESVRYPKGQGNVYYIQFYNLIGNL